MNTNECVCECIRRCAYVHIWMSGNVQVHVYIQFFYFCIRAMCMPICLFLFTCEQKCGFSQRKLCHHLTVLIYYAHTPLPHKDTQFIYMVFKLLHFWMSSRPRYWSMRLKLTVLGWTMAQQIQTTAASFHGKSWRTKTCHGLGKPNGTVAVSFFEQLPHKYFLSSAILLLTVCVCMPVCSFLEIVEERTIFQSNDKVIV